MARTKAKGKNRQQLGTDGADKTAPKQLEDVPDPAVVLLALDTTGRFAALAVGTDLRVFDRRQQTAVQAETLQQHSAPIRATVFSPDGSLLLTGGDDKLVRIWNTQDWSLKCTLKAQKKISTAAFSQSGRHVVFADRYGDLTVADLNQTTSAHQHSRQAPQDPSKQAQLEADSQPGSTQPPKEGQLQHVQEQQAKQAQQDSQQAQQHSQQAQQAQQAQQLCTEWLLGHFCSIVPAIAFSPDDEYIVSTDRDHKVRVSIMPPDPLQGAHEIQSMCMGHTSFVHCCTFVTSKGGHSQLLSGGGDGTIRLWDHISSKQLACFTLPPLTPELTSAAIDSAPVVPIARTADDNTPPSQSASRQSGQAASNGAAAVLAETGARTHLGDLDLAGDQNDQDVEEVPEMPIILSVAASPDGLTVAAAVQSMHSVLILHCDPDSGTLMQQQDPIQVEGCQLPSQVTFDAEGQLWVVAGPLPGTANAAQVAVVKRTAAGQDFHAMTSPDVLSDSMRQALCGRQTVTDSATHANQGAVGHQQQQVSQQLRKRVYPDAEKTARKKDRRDIKAAAAAH